MNIITLLYFDNVCRLDKVSPFYSDNNIKETIFNSYILNIFLGISTYKVWDVVFQLTGCVCVYVCVCVCVYMYIYIYIYIYVCVYWPPVRVVCPIHEEVAFQPQTGTTPGISSVAYCYVANYLSLPTPPAPHAAKFTYLLLPQLHDSCHLHSLDSIKIFLNVALIWASFAVCLHCGTCCLTRPS